MDQTLTSITDFVASVRFQDLPEAVVSRATEVLVDSLACATGGRDCGAARLAAAQARAGGTQGTGSVIGYAAGVAPDLAAFWNTSMIRDLDFNDLTSKGHPSDILGALLAVGPGVDASGEDVLTAMVIAYEIFIRLAETSVIFENISIDQGYGVAIAAAAGVSRLLGSTPEQASHAMAMAATSSLALRATRSGALSDYKGVTTAVSTRDAVFLASLAKGGLTGPSEPFEGRGGIVHLTTGEPGPLGLQDFGRWLSVQACIKYFPMAYNMQPSVWAALELRKQLRAEDLAKASLHVAPFSWHESGSEPEKWDPHTRATADHSLPYVFARALRYGTVDHAAYEHQAIREQATLDLMQKVEVIPDWDRGSIAPTVTGARLEAMDTGGQTYTISVDEPRGHHHNPMTRDEISAKAKTLIEPVLGPRTDAAVATAWDVADLPVAQVLEAYLPG